MTWTKRKRFLTMLMINFLLFLRSCLSILCQFINLKEKIIPIHQFQFKNWKNKIQFYCFIDKLYFVPLPQWVQQDRSSRFWVVLPRSPHRKYLWIVLANLLGAIFLHQPIFLCKNTKLQFVKWFKCSSRHNTNYVLHAKENLSDGTVTFEQNFFRFSKLTKIWSL